MPPSTKATSRFNRCICKAVDLSPAEPHAVAIHAFPCQARPEERWIDINQIYRAISAQAGPANKLASCSPNLKLSTITALTTRIINVLN